MIFPRLKQAGDTIIEVLIAVAILGSILGISYSITRRNIILLRDNQERTEATKAAQGQIDALLALWRLDQDQFTGPSAPTSGFCINLGTINGLGPGYPSSSLDTENFAQYIAQGCYSSYYHYAIDKVDEVIDDYSTYRIYVRWDSLSGERKELIYTYKLAWN